MPFFSRYSFFTSRFSFLIGFGLLVSTVVLGSQDSDKIEEYRQLKAQALSIFNKFQRLPLNQSDLSLAIETFSEPCSLPNPEQYRARALQARAEDYDRDWGLDIRGRLATNLVQNNADEDFVDDNDIGARSYVELSWDVLNEGFMGNTYRAKALYHEAELSRMQAEIQRITGEYRCRRHQWAKIFAGLSSQLLTLRLELMQSIYQVERRAYFKGWSQLDDLLVSEDELIRIRHELDYLHSATFLDEIINDPVNLPLIDIDMKRIAELIRNETSQTKITQLEKDILEYKEKARDNKRLRFFLRQGLINNDQFGKGNTSIGMFFKIPLTLDDEQALQHQLQEAESEAELNSWEKLVRVRYAYSQVRYQQKQVIKQYYRYQRALERLRRSMEDLLLGDERQLILALTQLKTTLDAAFELNEVKRELYWRVNEVFLLSHLQFQPEFLVLYPMDTGNNRARPWHRSLYLWSPGFNRMDNRNLLGFLQTKGIDQVLISAGKKTDHDKLTEFFKLADDTGLQTELIIGANEWVLPENHQRAALKAAIFAEKNLPLHLDIEPQVFDDFKQRQQFYLDNYLAMLSGIRKAVGMQQLTVAVPWNWSNATIYREISPLVDGVYIMLYGSRKLKTLTRRLQPLLQNIPTEKVVVVLRADDFENEWQLEQLMTELNQTAGISRFAIENFSRFFRLVSRTE